MFSRPQHAGDGGGAESSQQQGNAEAGNEANPEGGDASNGADGEEREGPRQQAQGSPAASASRNDGGRGGGQGIGEGRHPSQPRRDPMEELEEDEVRVRSRVCVCMCVRVRVRAHSLECCKITGVKAQAVVIAPQGIISLAGITSIKRRQQRNADALDALDCVLRK
eukprot:1156131-Pelagomonas_calceolata.AAC.10